MGCGPSKDTGGTDTASNTRDLPVPTPSTPSNPPAEKSHDQKSGDHHHSGKHHHHSKKHSEEKGGEEQEGGRKFREPSKVLIDAPLKKDGKTHDAAAKKQKDGHLVKNVFARKIQIDDDYKPPVHPKSRGEKSFIKKALSTNFVFENLAPEDLDPLVLAFEKWTANVNEEVIRQGEEGDYFYVLESGRCAFQVDGRQVGEAKAGASFGELALLYTAPRAATVLALDSPTIFFRVDQTTFRFILQKQTLQGSKAKEDLLKKVSFLKDLGIEEIHQLTAVMTPHKFTKGDYLMRKGDAADYFWVIKEGELSVTDIQVADTKYEDLQIGSGDYVGERALVTGDPRAANVVARTDGFAFYIDKETFETVLGNLNEVILRAQDQRKLAGIKILQDSQLDQKAYVGLSRKFTDKTFKKGDYVVMEGQKTDAALYFVRECRVELTDKRGTRKETIESGGYFGEDTLTADVTSGKNGPRDPSTTVAAYSVRVIEPGTISVLTLADCRKVIDTLYIGKPKRSIVSGNVELNKITMKDLQRHAILGAGTFGQVWLVSRKSEKGNRQPYALKIQSKYELVKDGQAKAVVDEKNIMAQLHHPFIINLVATFQDKKFVYMVLGLVQGGELFSIIHTKKSDGIPEKEALFYAAGVADGLAYMHRYGFVYRDLKPENVLIDSKGYPVIVDFGFAKFVEDKTYTLCGTPLYLPPEVILNRGHNQAADHWSLGVLIFEMISGDTPFYRNGMDQMELFRSIVQAAYTPPPYFSNEVQSIVSGLLTKHASKRLGNLANREDDIYNHAWFAKINFPTFRQREMKAPRVPTIKDPFDTSNFDDWSHLKDKTLAKFPPISVDDDKVFETF